MIKNNVQVEFMYFWRELYDYDYDYDYEIHLFKPNFIYIMDSKYFL